MKRNYTMMQFFEWHLPNDGDHWNRLIMLASELKEHGFNSLWIPPPAKGLSQEDNGYGVYDMYDLGEFDQKQTVRTKYGTKEELLSGIKACQKEGIHVYADVVMNHKAGADDTETFHVVEVHPHNRRKDISEPFEIDGWTRFYFPGRKSAYSDFTWHFHHFNGTDYDATEDVKGIYRILGDHKDWSSKVDNEFGNYDYLMFANIDYDHPEVREEMTSWGKWFVDTTNCNGFRLDAIKHINHDFISTFVSEMREHTDDTFYFVGEFWNPDLEACQQYLDHVDYQIDLFDVPLHYNFHQASTAGKDYDMSRIFEHALVATHPMNSVTFVDNHDSQPGGSLESWVEDWFKPIAYALILLRKDGFPCVFYGDYIGINGHYPAAGKKEVLDPLLQARYHYAYGEQHDYFDHGNTIGWIRTGDMDMPGSGCAVIVSNGDDGHKKMFVGEHQAGKLWRDVTGNQSDPVEIDYEGWGDFSVNGRTVSVYVSENSSKT